MRATSYLALLLSASTPIFASGAQYDVTVFSQPGCEATHILGGSISSVIGECINVPIVDETAQSFSYSYPAEPMFAQVYLENDCKGAYLTYLLDGPWTCHPLRDLKAVSIKVVHPQVGAIFLECTDRTVSLLRHLQNARPSSFCMGASCFLLSPSPTGALRQPSYPADRKETGQVQFPRTLDNHYDFFNFSLLGLLQLFCAHHVSSPTHDCEKCPLDDDAWTAAQTQELKALREKIDDQRLLNRASELNNGLPCELDASDPLGQSLMGGMHVHLRIRFSNSSTWLARLLRENYTSFSDEFSNRVIESECATLKWLDKIDVPSPRLHGYGLRNDPGNEVGVAYMLIDELPGTPLLLKNPSGDELRQVYEQWADILNTLQTHPFERIGSLWPQSNGEISVGPIMGDRTGTFSQMGPFYTAREYYSTFAEKYLEMICDGQLFSAYPVNAYLIFKYLQELADAGRWNGFESDLDNGPFFLKHMDDKGDHILVDDEYNITGIIDWTYARIVPAFEAFGPSLLTADMGDLYDGKAGRSGRDNLMAEILQNRDQHLGRMAYGPDLVRRFSFGLGMGMNLSWDEAKALFQGIISTATSISLSLDWDVWRRDRLYQWADDSRLQALLLQHGENIEYKKTIQYPRVHPVRRFSTCSVAGCQSAGVRGQSCANCKKHFCSTHLSKNHHTCPSSNELDDEAWEKSINDEVWLLLSHVNTHELVRLGTQLNNHIPCKFEPGKHLGVGATMGCANYHGWLVFDTGERWIVRIPRTGFSDTPPELVEYLVVSEYATLKFLERTNVPSPTAFAYGLASDPSNRVGASYIMMQALPGTPYYAHQASPEQKKAVIEALADILVEISKNPFPQAGSLLMMNDRIDISAIASNRFVALHPYGPFKTTLEYITSIIDQYMDLIADGQLHHEHPLEAFLFYHFLRRNADTLVAADIPGQFFLKHVDDKGDHLLVDQDFNITGIIDWQFARAVPAAEAFGPSYITADLTSLYSSDTGTTDDDRLLANALKDRGADDLASFAEGKEIMRRFHHGLASGMTKDEARDMIKGIVLCAQDREVEDLDAWITKYCRECQSDPRWGKIQSLLNKAEAQ
ncbi:uncharacterized protein N7459_009403 [Penicillium hispanicum]|uniref:uncharacterized protein n=1 Tax=Penicillium hispanicum TaxID=1080232 RepID=UPI00254030BC|nr:uncharacterized protein N7459_009403 [Penicillium hispanicum]KAJ5569973.1 hypothetical protein N7459_009403 [Penicillium hispanicum]